MRGPARLMGSNSVESNTGGTAKPDRRVTSISSLHALQVNNSYKQNIKLPKVRLLNS